MARYPTGKLCSLVDAAKAPIKIAISVIVSSNPFAVKHYLPSKPKHAIKLKVALRELLENKLGPKSRMLHLTSGIQGDCCVTAKSFLWTAQLATATPKWMSESMLMTLLKAAKQSGKAAVFDGAL